MKQKIKSILIFSSVALVLGGILLPLQPVHAAGLADLIGEAIKKLIIGSIDIFSIPLALVLMLIQIVTGILPFIAAEIMKVCIALNETIKLIPNGSSDMVSVGWQFTRDMANMFFILILAWVGMATILRLETYEVKKILPKLIIIALLINFIPVIAGVILDISNIITHYFAGKSSGAGEWLVGRLPMNDIIRGGWSNIVPGEGGIASMAVKSLMGIVFNLIAFFVLTLYAVLFILRIVAIWVLLVLAPIAWIGYIIPNGKKWWEMWWKQFLQWAMMGIPLTFFLFLSGLVLGQGIACEPQDINMDQYGFGTGVLAGIGGELLCSILPFVAGIAVLLIGFLMSITFAPTGADMVIKSAKKGGLAAGKVVGTKAWSTGVTGPMKGFRAYRDARRMGFSRRDSFGELNREVKRSIVPKSAKVMRDLSWKETITKGTWNAIKDVNKAGYQNTFGIKEKNKKKGFRPACPTCGNKKVSVTAATCPTCGHTF